MNSPSNPLRRPPAVLLSFRTVEETTFLSVPVLQHSRFATMKDASQVVELHKQYRRGCSSRAGKETPANPGPVNFLFPQSSVPTSGFKGSRATILQCLGDSILSHTKRTLSRRAPGPHRPDSRSMRIRAVSSERDNHRAHPFFLPPASPLSCVPSQPPTGVLELGIPPLHHHAYRRHLLRLEGSGTAWLGILPRINHLQRTISLPYIPRNACMLPALQ